MELSERAIQFLLGAGSIAISTTVSLALSQWFARREVAARESRDERRTDVEEFAEHRQAFRERILHLESKCEELDERVKEQEKKIERLENDLEDAEREKLSLMRVNFNLQQSLDICREQRSSGGHPRQDVA